MSKQSKDFESACAALPEGMSWGDSLTPEIVRAMRSIWAARAAETFDALRKSSQGRGNFERAYIYADVVVRIRAMAEANKVGGEMR